MTKQNNSVNIMTGEADQVECVYCKIKIQNWTDKSAPANRRHVKESPYCLFMQGKCLFIY